jgi:short subunit dehydrogenase-like uncharacterized protein
LCRYLIEQFGDHGTGTLQWAAAGRSQAKLQALRDELGPKAAKLALIVADAGDEAALKTLCAQTRVVISTVGPYALFGEPLVKVCAETGVDYCDLTGEVQWISRMIARYEGSAKKSGARIVHCCGFDSIPSDLGVLFLQQEAQKRFGQPCTTVKMRVKAVAGAASGGTVASVINIVKEAAKDPALRKELANPIRCAHPITALHNAAKRSAFCSIRPRFSDLDHAFHHGGHQHPHRAPLQCAVEKCLRQAVSLRRSDPDHHRFQRPAGRARRGVATASFMLALALPPTRWVMERFVVPKPGEGPSPAAQEKGFYDLRFFGRTDSGQPCGSRSPATATPAMAPPPKCWGRRVRAWCKTLPSPTAPGASGHPPPFLVQRLIERLQAKSGLKFEVLEG